MAIEYKFDVLQALKDKGFSSYRIRKEKIFSEKTLQAFREGEMVSFASLSKLCEILSCDIGDILTYKSENV